MSRAGSFVLSDGVFFSGHFNSRVKIIENLKTTLSLQKICLTAGFLVRKKRISTSALVGSTTILTWVFHGSEKNHNIYMMQTVGTVENQII